MSSQVAINGEVWRRASEALGNTRDVVKGLRGEVTELEDLLATSERERQVLRRAKQEAAEERAKAAFAIRRAMEDIVVAAGGRAANLYGEREGLERSIARAIASVENLRKSKDLAQSRAEDLAKQLVARDAEIARLRTQPDDVNRYQAENRTLREHIAHCKEELDNARIARNRERMEMIQAVSQAKAVIQDHGDQAQASFRELQKETVEQMANQVREISALNLQVTRLTIKLEAERSTTLLLREQLEAAKQGLGDDIAEKLAARMKQVSSS